MSTLYIHIGTWKTGSSTFQYNLNKNKYRLKDKGFLYLSKEEKMVIDDKIIGGFNRIETEFIDKSRKRLKSIIDNYNVNYGRFTLISSAEEFSGDPFIGFKNVKWVARNLFKITKGFGLNIKIIVYIRRQDDFVESLYTQSVRLGKSHSFSEYINTIDDSFFNWLDIVNSYAELFGKENIIIRRYHKKFLPHKNSLIKDFISIIGCYEHIELSDIISRNRGFNRHALEILRITNKYLEENEKKAFRKILDVTGSKKPYERYSFFTDEMRRDFLRMYNESNDELASRYLNTNESLFPEPENTDPEEHYYGGLTDEAIVVNFSKALIYVQNQSNKNILEISKINRNRFYRYKLRSLLSSLYKKYIKLIRGA